MDKPQLQSPAPVSQGARLDLPARAQKEMIANGFIPDFEPKVLAEVASLDHVKLNSPDGSADDLRSMLWSSIDNPESRDLDQIEVAEILPNGDIKVLIGIADVDCFVPKGSLIDKHALNNTTSVYTGVKTFPMLPDALSFDLTSLIEGADRRALVIEVTVNAQGLVTRSGIYAAIVRNHAKLDYISVGEWFDTGGNPPEKIAAVPGLDQQLLLQKTVADRIHNARSKLGSLQLQTLEATPVVKNGDIIDLELVEANQARDLIENLMIAGNIAISQFLEANNVPSLRRIVKKPERWDKIVAVALEYGEKLPAEPNSRALSLFLLKRKKAAPDTYPDLSLTVVKLLGRGEYTVDVPGQEDEGHFALAVRDYTHATAPNRRYPDLITQRLLKSLLAAKAGPYSEDELKELADHCTEMENAAKKVERTIRKVAAAVLLSKHIGAVYDGIVTGAKQDATYVRLLKPPAEGRIVKKGEGLDVGQKVKVKLIAVDAVQAHIDFEAVGS
jgi:exoribonuclease-2